MVLHIANGFAQRTVRLDSMVIDLLVEPPFEPVHQRLALRLVVCEALLGAQLRLVRLLVVVEDLAEHRKDHVAFVRKHLF